jgi:hypothetical protein
VVRGGGTAIVRWPQLQKTLADFQLVVFNSLCVLFGAIAVQKNDLDAVVPDLARNKAIIRKGFQIIHELTLRGGPKVVQSEKFLKVLLKTMTSHERNVS